MKILAFVLAVVVVALIYQPDIASRAHGAARRGCANSIGLDYRILSPANKQHEHRTECNTPNERDNDEHQHVVVVLPECPIDQAGVPFSSFIGAFTQTR